MPNTNTAPDAIQGWLDKLEQDVKLYCQNQYLDNMASLKERFAHLSSLFDPEEKKNPYLATLFSSQTSLSDIVANKTEFAKLMANAPEAKKAIEETMKVITEVVRLQKEGLTLAGDPKYRIALDDVIDALNTTSRRLQQYEHTENLTALLQYDCKQLTKMAGSVVSLRVDTSDQAKEVRQTMRAKVEAYTRDQAVDHVDARYIPPLYP